MPENIQGPKPEADSPITAYSAADALKLAEEHPLQVAPQGDEDESEEAAEIEAEKTPAEDEEEDAEEDSPDDEESEPDEAEDSDGDDEIPQLDPLIEELAKGNPKAEKRVQEIAKGLQKLKTEAKELKSELEKTKPQANFLQEWNQALSDPNLAGKALGELVRSVAKHHGRSPNDLLDNLPRIGLEASDERANLLPETDEYGRKRELWERAGYASPKEMELEDALRAVQKEVLNFKQDREQVAKEREVSRQQAEFKNYVDEVAPRTIKKLEKLENGWKVTRTMVEKAITEFPQLKSEPAKAVKAAFPDELKKHYASASQTRKARGPEMPVNAGSKGQTLPDPRRFSAKDALAFISG